MSWNKYGAKKVQKAGMWFDSKLESAVHDILKLRECAGEIEILKCQDVVKLAGVIEYRPDFKCLDKSTGDIFWVEAKGMQTAAWRIKLKLWRSMGPGRLELYKGTHARPILTETIVPKHKQGEENASIHANEK